LERIWGVPPPEAPPQVPTLEENRRGEPPRTMRARLEQHREDPACFSCHGVMDPLGFALENFNAVGQFRDHDSDTLGPIDVSGVLPNGAPVSGPEELRHALVANTDRFVQTLTENLLIFALGRTTDYRDMPTVRAIAQRAEREDFRFEAIVLGIVESDAFRKRAAGQGTRQASLE
jgi:hypothetical protein